MSMAPRARLRVGWLLGVVLVALVLVAPPGASYAATAEPSVRRAPTSCAIQPWDRTSVQTAAQGTDAVIAARLTRAVRTPGPAATNVRLPAYWTYTIRVVHTFRGSAQPGAVVSMTRVPVKRRLGTALPKGTYLFFVHQAGAGFTSDRCGGSVRLPHGLSVPLTTKLTADLGTTPAPGGEVTLSAPAGGIRDVPTTTRMVAPGVAVALLGILGLLLVGRLGRERS